MNIRPKLSGAPLAYTLAKVEGTADHYDAFGKTLWSEHQSVSAAMKELVFSGARLSTSAPPD